MRRFSRLWTGQLPLAEAFWTYAVVGGVAVNLVTSLLFLTLIAADRPVAALIVGYGLAVPYNVLVLVGVWRAAEQEGDRVRANLIRIVTLVGMILLSLT
jgi:hypothetical protein